MSLTKVSFSMINGAPANVLDFGAVGNGVTDDSSAFQNAVNSGATLVFVPSGSYIVKNVNIPEGVTLSGYGATVRDKTGASYIFKITGYASAILGIYVENAQNCSSAAIIVDDGKFGIVKDVTIIDCTSGVKMQSSSNGANGYGCTKATLDNVKVDTFSGTGIAIGPNVHDNFFSNCYCDAGQATGTGGYIPKLGSIGFSMIQTGSVVARGGNSFTNCLALNCQTGLKCVDATLDNFVNLTVDNMSAAGIELAGDTTKMMFANTFCGVCATAVLVSGVGTSNRFTGLYTSDIGVIPAGGGTNFYSSAGYTAPFFELTQAGTAYLTIDLNNWSAFGTNAHTFTEAVADNIQMTGGARLSFNSNGTVAAGSTVYLGVNGQSALNGSAQVPLSNTYSIANAKRVFCQSDIAPGVGQTFTYTLIIGSSASTITGASTGAGVFQATMGGAPSAVSPNQSISIKLDVSASAALATHRGYVLLIPQPS